MWRIWEIYWSHRFVYPTSYSLAFLLFFPSHSQFIILEDIRIVDWWMNGRIWMDKNIKTYKLIIEYIYIYPPIYYIRIYIVCYCYCHNIFTKSHNQNWSSRVELSSCWKKKKKVKFIAFNINFINTTLLLLLLCPLTLIHSQFTSMFNANEIPQHFHLVLIRMASNRIFANQSKQDKLTIFRILKFY